MKRDIITVIVFLAASISNISCNTPRPSPDDSLDSKIQYTVKYSDRNGDGKIDCERHNAIGACDADWELRDDDYSGRYERRIDYGYSVTERTIDQPVPTHNKSAE